MEGIKSITRKMGHGSAGGKVFGGGSTDKKYRDGIGKCGHYDTELDQMGWCRDEACRSVRLEQDLKNGHAQRTPGPDGTIVWIHSDAMAKPEEPQQE